jgi:hypothetical protein
MELLVSAPKRAEFGGGVAEEGQRVRAEIEFLSRNFLQHFHDPKECDLIVCWENNWPDCPLEGIELKRQLADWIG